MEEVMVSGVTLDQNEAKITMFNVPDRPGTAAKIFKKLADDEINIDMIIQNKTTTKKTDISFTVYKSELKQALESVRRVARSVGVRQVSCDQNIAKVSVVGVGMRSHSGVASKMFNALAKSKINSRVVLASEKPRNRLFNVGGNWIQRREYRTVKIDLEAVAAVTRDEVAEVLAEFPLSQNTTFAIGPLADVAAPE